MMSRDMVIMTADTPDGFMVARAGREHITGNRAPYFTCGIDVYRSRRAWDVGAEPHSCYGVGGDYAGAVSHYFPELIPISAMSGAWTDTGEPLHGPANGWYRLSGADMAHEIDGLERFPARKNYYQAPAHRHDYDHLSPDFAMFFVDMAARCLRVSVDDLPNVQDERLFAEWVETVARPRWQSEAEAANALLDELAVRAASQQRKDDRRRRSEESCSFSLGYGAERISVRAWQPGGDFKREAYREGAGWYYQYRVVVRACGTSYTTTYGGSVADHDAGRHDARGACNCVLRELSDALNQGDGESWAKDMGYEPDAEGYRSTVRALDRCVAAAERMRPALEANADVVAS